MFKPKSLLIGMALIASVGLLTACSSDAGKIKDDNTTITVPPDTINEELVSVDFTTEKTDDTLTELTEFPSITVSTPTSFIFFTGGSSSCPNVIEDISINTENKVFITYEAQPQDRACTMDFKMESNLITLNGDVDITDASFVVVDNGTEFPVTLNEVVL